MKKQSGIIVLKIGGSFFADDIFKNLKQIFKDISELDEKGIVITAGGGSTADIVRGFDRKNKLGDSSAHFAAVSAMDVNAYMLSSFLNDYKFLSVDEEELNIKEIKNRKISIFLPSSYYRKYDPLPHSWDISSDSIACELADRIGAEELILLKARDPLSLEAAKLRNDSSASENIHYQNAESLTEEGLIDKYFPIIFNRTKVKTTILNGRYYERTAAYLKGENPILTRIS